MSFCSPGLNQKYVDDLTYSRNLYGLAIIAVLLFVQYWAHDDVRILLYEVIVPESLYHLTANITVAVVQVYFILIGLPWGLLIYERVTWVYNRLLLSRLIHFIWFVFIIIVLISFKSNLIVNIKFNRLKN